MVDTLFRGSLFLVSTPIGNLSDITLRALKTLKDVDLILCEDTRRAQVLLSHYEIKKPLLSCHEHNEEKRIPEIIEKLKGGNNIALITDSGTPSISDPGFKLVRECIAHQIKIEAIPGASAVLSALVVSGKSTDKFLSIGFLPKKKGKKTRLLESVANILKNIKTTIVLFESPYRIVETLEIFKKIFGNIEIVIARELTKKHEEIRREKILESLNHFQKIKPKGEFTIII